MSARRELIRLGAVTALVGVSSGVAGIAVYCVLQIVQFVAFGFRWGSGAEAAENASAVGRFAALTAAGILVAFAWWALRRWGKPVVGVERAVGGERMHSMTTPLNALVQVVAVGLGASIGKEVAPREAGAWLAQRITSRAGLTPRQTRILVACGASAGLAAVYDVPFSGALFAVEVLLGEITVATALPAFATSAIAAYAARAVIPVETLYQVPHAAISPSLVVWSLLAGPVIGLAGSGFAAVVRRAQRGAPSGKSLLVVLPVVFALVGVVAIWFPEILGNGRATGLEAMRTHLSGGAVMGLAPIAFVLILGIVKAITTTATIGSGAVGGTLTPSIALGAALGAGLGGAWLLLWPGSGVVAFAMIGAAAFLATTMKAPFTALALVFEFTHQGMAVLIPALLAVAGAIMVGSVLERRRLVGVEQAPDLDQEDTDLLAR